jgi:hypothetical protein
MASTSLELDRPLGGGEMSSITRRDAIRKAAVGGAIVWTAPLISSSPVSAASCTIACAPTLGSEVTGLQVLIEDDCAVDTGLDPYTTPANKIARLSIAPVVEGACPCNVTVSPTIEILSAPTALSKGNDPIGGACEAFTGPDVEAMTRNDLLPADQHLIDPNELVICKTGAIGNGWYTGNNPLCVSFGCPDEIGGDMVYRNCRYLLCFEYMPAGSCDTMRSLRYMLTPLGCGVGCTQGC